MRTFSQHPDNLTSPEWWRGAVIYQIYPRSFADSNGDGIGDLAGISTKLPYVASLGVDAIWISPFFTSPMKDFGYDVSDYCDVDPMFGTLADFKALVEQAHSLGLRVIIDQVLSHTSDRHPWFIESRASHDNPKADWYVWGNPKDDGTPPNNWLSIFLGSSWQWESTREQYYLHNFLASQPDLNLHHPEVQNALFDVLRFWLDLGVDGFRLDTVNFYFHDAQLRDNPARGRPKDDYGGAPTNNPYSWQQHVYDKSRPENLVFLQAMRRVLDEYSGIMTVGEVGDDHALERMAEYTGGGDKLHTAYSFHLLGERHEADWLHATFREFEQKVKDGWACWSLSNHDVTRMATRWHEAHGGDAALRAFLSMQLTLRGNPGIYQGDELGLPEAKLKFEQLQDPYGISMWPAWQGRDGARTPMPWDANAAQAGFSTTGETWLPVVAEHLPLAVAQQDADPNSLLNYLRLWLRQRRAYSVLKRGAIEFLPSHPQVLAYIRSLEGQRLLCVFNLSDTVAEYHLPTDVKTVRLAKLPQISSNDLLGKTTLHLAPWQTLLAECT